MRLIERTRRSIQFRLLILLVAMSAVILALATTLFGWYGWTLQRRQFEQQLVAMANLVALNSAAPLAFDDLDTAREDMHLVQSGSSILYAAIRRPDGSVFAEAGAMAEGSPPLHHDPGQGMVDYLAGSRMRAAIPIVLNDRVIGQVHIEEDLSGMNRQVITVVGSAIAVFLATLFVAVLLAARIGRTITGPITRLAAMVRMIADRGRVDTGDFIASPDEVGDLARGINTMLDSLERSRRELEQSLSQQRTLFDTIPMPVYAKDLAGTYIAMNHRYALDVLGDKPEVFIGRNREQAGNGHDAGMLDHLAAREADLGSSGMSTSFEVTGHDANGELRVYRAQLGLFRDQAGTSAGLIGVLLDITEIRRIGKELVDVSMREQQRLARDLHDNLGQLLTATAMRIKALEYAAPEGDEAMKAELRDVTALVNRSAREARALSHGLNPVDIERGGLLRALEELAASTEVYARLTCRFTSTGPLPEIDKDASNQLYRIAQEAVNNAVRHASATRIDLHLGRTTNEIVLSIRDNGRGIPQRRDGTAAGMGLRIMHQRALMIQGTLHCNPRPSGGTEVVCRHPIDTGT
ncbi:MAG TPA: histidine kinase [Kiritimatiellia bacterium]|nr:histidine kinase [Kiritimatiellia bacterium]HMP33533.1 histidine kinase [Kiritimatiellia bacterium]